jgi:hypothetical protein
LPLTGVIDCDTLRDADVEPEIELLAVTEALPLPLPLADRLTDGDTDRLPLTLFVAVGSCEGKGGQ